jgi:sigma-54-specific transcriptional regulator
MPVLTLPPSENRLPPGRAKASVFEDPRSRALLERVQQLAPSEATVLIIGETGTGKEIVARQLHQLSRRADRPFLAVNCGAFSETLIESDLFGHEKGAFTGAARDKAGWFESAQGGTLFLDEIADLPLALQVKLLRVLQEREVVRLGSNRPIPVDVRLIAATNVKLKQAVASGRFRADLFYRLAVAEITIDALRDRPGDILPLCQHFIEVYAGARPGAGPAILTSSATQALRAHDWPGNIRELENAIHHAVLVCRDGRITRDDLPFSAPAMELVRTPPPAVPTSADRPEPRAGLREILGRLYAEGAPGLWSELERTIIDTAFQHAQGNQLRTARLLGLSRSIVRARLLEFGLIARAERERELNPTVTPAKPAWRDRSGGHVLVVEDDSAIRTSLAELLESSGYEVSLAENGQVALQLLYSAPIPDVIVLDLKMPVMDGWQFREIQRDDPRLGRIPVVAISADRNAATSALSVEAYLRKPLDAGEFLGTIQRTHRPRAMLASGRAS